MTEASVQAGLLQSRLGVMRTTDPRQIPVYSVPKLAFPVTRHFFEELKAAGTETTILVVTEDISQLFLQEGCASTDISLFAYKAHLCFTSQDDDPQMSFNL